VTAIGEGLARAGERSGLVYLRRLRALPENLELQRRRLRAAMRLQAWPEIVEWVEALPAAERERGEWQYWLARALGKRGDMVGAVHALDAASAERDLWGFRAAELLGREPALRERTTPGDPAEIERLLASDTARRIRELQALGRTTDVTREWRELTRHADAEQLRTAALLGQRLGLVTESIFTLARSDYWDDISLRFPLRYTELVAAHAEQNGLPPEWVYAVIRQESAFDADVASHAGAIGLMQLMPGTARDMARELARPAPGRVDLIDPALNIALGARYLAAMRERFGGNQVLATAAYNAGPGAVSRWLPEAPMAADLWMIAIPYRETRDYVRRVLTYRVIYAHRLGLDGFRLGALLAPVRPPPAPATAAAH
jgi:soluble lytic murein transglycosylase